MSDKPRRRCLCCSSVDTYHDLSMGAAAETSARSLRAPFEADGDASEVKGIQKARRSSWKPAAASLYPPIMVHSTATNPPTGPSWARGAIPLELADPPSDGTEAIGQCWRSRQNQAPHRLGSAAFPYLRCRGIALRHRRSRSAGLAMCRRGGLDRAPLARSATSRAICSIGGLLSSERSSLRSLTTMSWRDPKLSR